MKHTNSAEKKQRIKTIMIYQDKQMSIIMISQDKQMSILERVAFLPPFPA
jgi:hypothetical protein